ncbi:MAG: hypothetical protein WKF55_11730 [Gemmatimonadaceae bacterium]
MRTIWKRATYVAVITGGIAVAAVSCTDTATSPRKSDVNHSVKPAINGKVNELRAKYGWPGDYHTRALEYAFSQLMKQNARSLSPAAKCRLAEAALRDFNKAYRKDGQPMPFADVSFAGTACNRGAKQQIVEPSGVPGVLRKNEISADASALLAQVDAAVDNNESVEAIRSAIYSIQGTAAFNLQELEAGAVISAGEVAISSVDYWDANQDEWQSGGIGGNNDGPIAYARNGYPTVPSKIVVGASGTEVRLGLTQREKRIIKADIGAFIGTIVYEWFLGPIGLSNAAGRAAAASIAAGILPY